MDENRALWILAAAMLSLIGGGAWGLGMKSFWHWALLACMAGGMGGIYSAVLIALGHL